MKSRKTKGRILNRSFRIVLASMDIFGGWVGSHGHLQRESACPNDFIRKAVTDPGGGWSRNSMPRRNIGQVPRAPQPQSSKPANTAGICPYRLQVKKRHAVCRAFSFTTKTSARTTCRPQRTEGQACRCASDEFRRPHLYTDRLIRHCNGRYSYCCGRARKMKVGCLGNQ